MASLRVFRLALVMEWKEMWSMDGIMFSFVSTLGTGIVTAWILANTLPGEARDHLYFGTPFLAVWVQGMSRTGLVLQREQWQGTLELMLTGRSPMFLIMVARAVAIATAGLLPAALILAIVYLATGIAPQVASAGLFAMACGVALLAVVATSLLFSPLTFVYAQRPAVLNAVWPIGAALGGFLYPSDRLPASLEAVSRLLPTSSAVEAVVASANGGGAGGSIALAWAASLGAIAIIFVLTGWLFTLADRRIRDTGVLAR